jgi:hypothetical protein
VKITLKYILAAVLAGFFSPEALVFAQREPDIFYGGRDVLYAQSHLLHSIDQAWYAPVSSATPGAPFSPDSLPYKSFLRGSSECREP